MWKKQNKADSVLFDRFAVQRESAYINTELHIAVHKEKDNTFNNVSNSKADYTKCKTLQDIFPNVLLCKSDPAPRKLYYPDHYCQNKDTKNLMQKVFRQNCFVCSDQKVFQNSCYAAYKKNQQANTCRV